MKTVWNYLRVKVNARVVVLAVRTPAAPVDQPPNARNINLKKALLVKYEYTDGCPGCRSILERWKKNPAHWAACRKRIEEEMLQSAEGREQLRKHRERRGEPQGESEDSGAKRQRLASPSEQLAKPKSVMQW